MEETITVPEHTRRKKAAKDWSSLREIEIISVSDEERQCTCGHENKPCAMKQKELLDYQPATLRLKSAAVCKHGCRALSAQHQSNHTVLPKVGATEHLLATVVVSKLHDRQPFVSFRETSIDCLSRNHGPLDYQTHRAVATHAQLNQRQSHRLR